MSRIIEFRKSAQKAEKQSVQGKTCAFTGHRPQSLPFGFDESDKRCTSLKSVMRDQIVALIENEGADAKAKDLINKTDKKRASYYNYYTNKKWGEAASYELCLNSSELGVQGTAKAIEQYILLKESIEKEARNIV